MRERRRRIWVAVLVMLMISLPIFSVAGASSPFSLKMELAEVEKETALVCFRNFWATEKINDYTKIQGVSFSPFLLYEGKIGVIPRPPVGILYGFGNEKVRRGEGALDIFYTGVFLDVPIKSVNLLVGLDSMKVDAQGKNLNFSLDLGSLNAYLDMGENRFVLESLMIRPGLALEINVASGLNLEIGIDYTYVRSNNWKTLKGGDLPEPEFDISGWSGKVGIRLPW